LELNLVLLVLTVVILTIASGWTDTNLEWVLSEWKNTPIVIRIGYRL